MSERRSVRTTYKSEGNRLVGYAAVWDTPTTIKERGRTFTEVVKRGAFARAIKEGQDVVCCVDHDEGKLLGRTRSGTLALAEDDRGLRFEVALPESAAAVRELVQRGDLDGASFSFNPVHEQWDGDTRQLTDVDLFDVAVVVRPAYPTTEVAVRSTGWKYRNNLLRKMLPSD